MTRIHRLLLAGACAAGVLLPAGSALAAPDRRVELGTAQPTASWNGKLGTGVTAFSDINALPDCGTPVVHDCDYTLVHVTEPGTILIETAADGPNTVDVALTVYDSDADGTMLDSWGTNDGSTADESAVVDNTAPAGTDVYYLVEISYLIVAGGQPAATATFTPAP